MQHRPAHPASLPAPHVPDGRTVCQPATHCQGQTVSGPATPEIFIPVTNAIESINFQLRKIIKNRGHFSDDDAAMKLLYLGIRNITGRHIDCDGLTRERGERSTGAYGWKTPSTPWPSASATGSPSNPPLPAVTSKQTKELPLFTQKT